MSTDGFIVSPDGKTLLKCDFSKLGTQVTVPAGITKIGNAVFAEAPVTSVILPDSVTELGENVFSSCETLKEVKLSSSITALKPFTFAGCSSLEKITMSENISSLPEGVFWGCASLKEIPFRNGMQSLETDVCRDCENITSVQIPPTVKTIKSGALTGCTNLSTIVFPAGLESIADRSLSGLQNLKYMRFAGDCDNFFVDENNGGLYQFTDNGAVLIKCPVNIESIYLVENTCDIHIDAFECCSALQEVYANENAPETLINRLMELIPHLDINSYNDEPSEEEQFASQIEHLGENLDDVKVNEDEFSPIGEFTQNDSYDESDSSDGTEQESESTPEDDMAAKLADIMGTSSEDTEETEENGEAEVSINQNELESILNQHNVVKPEPEETEEETSAASDNDEEARIQEILNSQCCRNDSLDDGFRPVTMDELERLMSNPVVDPMEQLKASEETPAEEPATEVTEPVIEETSEEVTEPVIEEKTEEPVVEEKPKKRTRKSSKKKTEEAASEVTEPVIETEAAEEKPKKRTRKSSKKKDEEAASEEKPKKRTRKSSKKKEQEEAPAAEEPAPAAVPSEEQKPAENEPRFIRAMKNLASHQMVLEEDENQIESVYGDLKELLVIADGVAPSTNDFSSHLVKFTKDVAKKYGFTKIYFFEDLPLDNPEFIYGLGSFGNFRNVLYACNKPCSDKISTDQKELINAAGISLPESCKIQSVKEKLADVELQYPVKILVQDNYIEGLLYCAEKYREDHGIK